MNKSFEKQVSIDMPGNPLGVHIPLLAEHALMLGEQLCFVCWDQKVYNEIVRCMDELDEAATASSNSPLQEQVRRVRSLLSAIAPGNESGDINPFSSLIGCLRRMQTLAGNL